MGHTPGPWRAMPEHGRIVLNVSAIYGVADITGDYANWNHADLTLMAAAPELLDALRQAVTALNVKERFKVQGTDSYAIAALCDKAIAKAEGGADAVP